MFPTDIEELEDLISKTICTKDEGFKELRFSVSTFRGKLYFSLRWWLRDFEDNWFPTKEGLTLPYQLSTASVLYNSFVALLAEAEVLEKVLGVSTNEGE